MKGKVKADLILNGVIVNSERLSQLLAYVSQDTALCPDMSTRQALLFTSLVQRPAKKSSFDTKKRTNALLEELGLSEVRHTCISDLTDAEKKRLLIAINLLLDTDILLLDQPTKGMDIFDTFFLVEYLRQWALISGRCVIMTISPSTYEIFTMLSRIALISSGRVVYFGKRSDLLTYFAQIDFPCPAFKNPSDYYLDLVTLDNLSSEAMLESSQRIESLVELYSRRHNSAISAPGPPSITPPPVQRANIFIQFLALWIRAMIFTFPYNVIHMFFKLLVALCLSVMCGVIYWHVRSGREQEYIWDRIGFYHAILTIFTIPLLLIEIKDVHKEKQYVLNEVKLQFYGKSSYLISKLIYSLPQALIVFIAFSLPACSMAGLQQNLSIYLLLMLSYLLTLRMIAISIVWTFNKRSTSAVMLAFVLSLIFLSAGTTFHYKDLSIGTRWLNYVSPTRWAHEALINWEFDNNSTLSPPFLCSRNPIVQQPNAILVRADCGFQSKANVLKWFRYKGAPQTGSSLRPIWHPFAAFAAIFGFFMIGGCLLFCLLAKRKSLANKTNS
ncbi:unnamed protein product [Oppiella nova]|uniref:ABC transporter domain-containing protein n=1 Tax=Oppiella nova TaxID=334625 RepID=A0A7R9LZG9_9ACAR|nr:unnamed protein product [Oppiella nova]CAG2167830.1 unnamed protein product [Oppiella nova]